MRHGGAAPDPAAAGAQRRGGAREGRMASSGGLPGVKKISVGAPFRWLGGAWRDLWRAWPPLLTYGVALSAFSLWISLSFLATGGAFWVFALTCGFVFVAPMLAMTPRMMMKLPR